MREMEWKIDENKIKLMILGGDFKIKIGTEVEIFMGEEEENTNNKNQKIR